MSPSLSGSARAAIGAPIFFSFWGALTLHLFLLLLAGISESPLIVPAVGAGPTSSALWHIAFAPSHLSSHLSSPPHSASRLAASQENSPEKTRDQATHEPPTDSVTLSQAAPTVISTASLGPTLSGPATPEARAESLTSLTSRYAQSIRAALEQALDKEAPLDPDAISRVRGHLTLQLVVSAEGQLRTVALRASSGSSEWDSQVLQVARKMTLPPPPNLEGSPAPALSRGLSLLIPIHWEKP